MGYTISWEPLRFTDFTYKTIINAIPSVISNGSMFIEENWGFSIGARNPNGSINIDNCVGFNINNNIFTWSKTNRLPYTKDVMKALILMVEYGVTYNLNHDDTDMSWYLTALDEVHAVRPLASYEWQKKYFIELGMVKAKAD
jgi:hypothetical protein